MSTIGFQFTRFSAQKNDVRGQITVKTNIGISSVQPEPMQIPQAKAVPLRISFVYDVIYEPNAGKIVLEGFVIQLVSVEQAQAAQKLWDEKKALAKDIITPVMNTIFTKCQLQSIILSKDLNLASPVQLRKLKFETPAQAPSTSSAPASSSKQSTLPPNPAPTTKPAAKPFK